MGHSGSKPAKKKGSVKGISSSTILEQPSEEDDENEIPISKGRR
jgi:hypothetical protein